MSNLFADARTAIVDALDVVLPGRVFPYEPEHGLNHRPGGGPSIWLDVALPAERQAATGAKFVTVQFPVVFSFDGADHAQVAGLDELQSKALAAISALPNTRWVGVTVPTREAGKNRSIVHTYETRLGVASFCAPTVTPADIPPPIVRAAA